jgi:hypothetical protein
MKMSALRAFLLIVAFAFGLTYQAKASDINDDVQKEARVDVATFGTGVAEAWRTDPHSRRLAKKQRAPHWEQVGADYRIKWVIPNRTEYAPFPSYLKVTKNGFVVSGVATIGRSKKEDITDWLGQPDSIKENAILFRVPGFLGDETAIFTFANGTLKSVEWEWFYE